jgi:hypothetical protein
VKCQSKAERTEIRRRCEVHRRHRNRARAVVDTANSGEGFHRLGTKSLREKKSGEGGSAGLFIGAVILQKKLGFVARGDRTEGRASGSPGTRPEEEEDPV